MRNKLTQIWKNLSKWGVTSIGIGFFEFFFSSLEDVKRVRSTIVESKPLGVETFCLDKGL